RHRSCEESRLCTAGAKVRRQAAHLLRQAGQLCHHPQRQGASGHRSAVDVGVSMSNQAANPSPRTIEEMVAELRAKRAEVQLGGGKDRTDKQHAAGKLTARERVEGL